MKKIILFMLFTWIQIMAQKTETATFAGGCFWCLEPPFEKMYGVISVVSGYIGGHKANPTYEEVCSGTTGHYEAIQINYDPVKVSYDSLLAVFWRQIDPTDPSGQFVDKGSQYRTAVFYHSDDQKNRAEQTKEKLAKSGVFDSPIVTKIIKATTFYPAEGYHQDYYKKDPFNYSEYRSGSGRDLFINLHWNIKNDQNTKDNIKSKLTPLQYAVTQECGTEPAFDNEYWDNHREGIYVDLISGDILFSSKDKFDSGSGWPSFTKPVDKKAIRESKDSSLGMLRIEVKSASGAHLGHVFDDGPGSDGLRYCINSAAMKFIPRDKMEAEGYGRYLNLFAK